jgi:serine/threonine-protein kinase
VPFLRNKTLSQVGTILEDRHLTLGTVTEVWSETIKKGLVISSTPRAGTEVRPDASVSVNVSKGPQPIKIPDFTGKSADRAEDRLTELGFTVKKTEENSDTVDKGKVISQDPDKGKGHKGDEINLVVSKGPVMVEVPSLRAMSVTDATQTLDGLGFDIEVRHNDLYIGLDRVVQQSPGSGEYLPKGSTVIVYVV